MSRVKKIDYPNVKSLRNEFVSIGEPLIFYNKGNTYSNSDFVEREISKHLGHIIVKVRTGDYGEPNNYINNRNYVEERLSDFIQIVKSGASDVGYAGNISFPKYIASQLGIDFPFYNRKYFERPTLWLGPSGSVTPLHMDSADNFIHQIVGRKRLLIFHPKDIPNLQMSTPFHYDNGFLCSSLDLRKLTLSALKKHRGVNGIEVVLSPSEVLYLPAGWVHFVQSLSISMTVNMWLDNSKVKPLWAPEYYMV